MPLGKMFGVLVVRNTDGRIGYLMAFSGKLVDEALPDVFVPPICDIFEIDSFYRIGEQEINIINAELYDLEINEEYLQLKLDVELKNKAVEETLSKERAYLKVAKKDRKTRRNLAKENMNAHDFEAFNRALAKESIDGQNRVKKLTYDLKSAYEEDRIRLEELQAQIVNLKISRKTKSAALQEKIFENYKFLNQKGEIKKLTEIFPNFKEQKPPAGSGDCSAPKLLQYAYQNNLEPIAMGEFWWGTSPDMEIRRHKTFYPACGSRCKPILAHMLIGLDVDENPLLKMPKQDLEIQFIYEDKDIVVINKPPELMSVPGKMINESVYTRMKAKIPNATGPLIVHRLDMSTSGLLIITKTKEANKLVQEQFIKRTVKKRYVAILDGHIDKDEGVVELPLRVDLDDRPRQLVCYEHGKPAKTIWKVLDRENGKTRVQFIPITGRTHQLRVHASHPLGLSTPIVGDDLYGEKGERLHLHAAFIEFVHPTSKEIMTFNVEADF